MNSLFDPPVTITTKQAQQLWQDCLQELQFSMEKKDLDQWLRPLQVELEGTALLLVAPNPTWLRQVQDKYFEQIQQYVLSQAAGITQVYIKQSSDVQVVQSAPKKARLSTQIAESNDISPDFTFERFVKGRSNAQAYSALYELSRRDSTHDYGSIFLYGSSGLGKTHLMQAMAHRYQKHGKSFCYFTKDSFFDKITTLFLEKKIAAFIKKICKADLLIIDDVHAINSKSGPKVSQILLTFIDEFAKTGKQIVLASDRHPSQMEHFDDRFLSRFSGGLLLQVEPPDMEMRVQILEKKASLLSLDLPKDCAIFMAQNLPGTDVRSLEGAIKRLDLAVKLQQEPVSLSLLRAVFRDEIAVRARALNAENIRDLVAKYYDVSPKDLMSKKRARNIARPRQMAMALIRELTRDSFPEIGQAFGGRDHTTVMHACDKVEELRQLEPAIEKDYRSLKMMLGYA